MEASTLRLEDMTAPLALIDRQGAIARATAPAVELLTRLDAGARLPDAMKRDLDRAPGRFVWTSSRTGEETLRVSGTAYAIDAAHLLLSLQDAAEHERRLSARLRRQAELAIGHVAASVAFHLRAPLASMVLNASAMRHATHNDPSSIRGILEDLERSVTGVRGQVETLLDFAHIGPPRNGRVSLRRAVDGASQLAPLAALSITIEPGASEAAANGFAVEQILTELFSNAIATAGVTRVMVTTQRASADAVEIHVRDDGPGVQPALAHLVFEPFFTTRSERTGIGLTNARELARSIGGSLSLRSAERGAVFVLVLPAAPLEVLA